MDAASVLQAVQNIPQLQIAKQGNNYRFTLPENESFPYEGATITEATAYLNFDANNKLTALKMTYKGTTPSATGTQEIEATVTMSGFTGDIAFPDLSGYKSAVEAFLGA
jgi:hypothetical protein